LAAIGKKLSTNFEIAQPNARRTLVAVMTPSWMGRSGLAGLAAGIDEPAGALKMRCDHTAGKEKRNKKTR
jgi:ABC-type thiamine transport system ATPase subunit